MKILISGASGFIGENLINFLGKNTQNKIYALVTNKNDSCFVNNNFSNVIPITCDLECDFNDFSLNR